VLGLDVVWDKEAEAKLNKGLDFELARAEKHLEHEVAVYEIINPVNVRGTLWVNGIFPEEALKGFHQNKTPTGTMKLLAGERVTVRKLDDEEWYRVDVENSKGRILTIHPNFWKGIDSHNARRIIDSKPYRRRMSSLYKDIKNTRTRGKASKMQKMPKGI
jgi:hypothetical protein